MQKQTPQNRHITSLTKAFLRVHWTQEKPLLLGYSGGPDSKALLYALLECGIKPHVAHVDHGWREESRMEAEMIKREIEALKLPFFQARFQPIEKSEDEARTLRYGFFSQLFAPYAALILAHQADDLAETVLKRLFEGANLSNLGGMQEVSYQHGMCIWRPFLKIKREHLLEFLKERSLPFFNDSSNSDPAYLRARMREELVPFLKDRFGKEIRENLCTLSERALELKDYLDQKLKNVPIQKGPWGTLVDLQGLEKIEKRHIIQKIAHLNRDQLNTLLIWLENREKSKILDVKSKKILVDGERVWFFSGNLKD